MQMQDLSEKEMLGGGLRIGPFDPQDADSFAAAARESAQSMAPWMPWCHTGYSTAEAAAWIELCATNLRDDIAYDLGIYDAGRQILLGGISINRIDRMNSFGNIGYWVRESHRGAGIAARAVRLIARFGFLPLNLMRLEIVAATGNHPSIATARRAGAYSKASHAGACCCTAWQMMRPFFPWCPLTFSGRKKGGGLVGAPPAAQADEPGSLVLPQAAGQPPPRALITSATARRCAASASMRESSAPSRLRSASSTSSRLETPLS
ncbi:MAG: rimL [Betaproteobacteria bacterium]|nr:rimL [Betaproteobacteria bacterium]